MLELNRKQELQLIQIGLETLLTRSSVTPVEKRVYNKTDKIEKPMKKKYKMSAAARKAVSERMIRMWAKKRKLKQNHTK